MDREGETMDGSTRFGVEADPEDVGLCSRRLARVRSWMESYVDAGKLPGALTLVARRGKLVFLETLGRRDVEAAKPLELDTIFRIYSMTKPITSVAVMMLYEEGHFQLDDPVSRYIQGFEEPLVHVSGEGARMRTEPARSPITVHHLLTHTSGLTYGFWQGSPVAQLYRESGADFGPGSGPLAEVVERLCQIPLLFHPGERWHYGVSTDVLGHLVEVVSGKTLAEFFQERIFGPLGMVDTGFVVAPEKVERFAALYGPAESGALQRLEGSTDSAFTHGVTTFSGGGGLLSTIADYYRFTQMLRGEGAYRGARLLGRKTLGFMTRNHLPGDLAAMGQASFNEMTFEGIGFGLGFSVLLDAARSKVLGSPGEYAWGGLASTAFWIDPAEDMTVIFLTQLSPSSTYPLRRELRVLTYQALVDRA